MIDIKMLNQKVEEKQRNGDFVGAKKIAHNYFYNYFYVTPKMNKLHAILILPLLPIAILIDLIFGDMVTKVKTPALKKLREHKQAWINMWNGA